MQYFFHEPTYGNMPSGQATSSVIANNVRIGRDAVSDENTTAYEFCHAKGYFLDNAFYGRTNTSIAYFDDATMTWKTKSEKPIHQVLCVDSIQATTSVNISLATGTINFDGGYNGPNFYEWLFVLGVIIFLVSFSFWGKISFTKP